jgi:uncharacterized RDD family membrane protein YckC
MAASPDELLYATFARRVRALVLDGLILLGVLLAVAVFAAMVHLAQQVRVGLFFGIIALAILYEPVLVSTTGQTVGHWLCNIRIVAPTATGRLPFWKAFLRWLLKGLSGLASFATMGATQRNQALHDLPFGTTVQVADPARATAHDFIHQRPALARGELPSRIRRAVVLAGYLVILLLLLLVAVSMVASDACLETDHCQPAERFLAEVLFTGWLAASIAVGIFGWQGRLLGARRKSPVSAPLSEGSPDR